MLHYSVVFYVISIYAPQFEKVIAQFWNLKCQQNLVLNRSYFSWKIKLTSHNYIYFFLKDKNPQRTQIK